MANVKDIRDFIEKCEATDATIYQMPKRLTRSLSYLRELLAEVERLERDAARLDWLETKVVNVREPLRHGSSDMFWASPPDDDELADDDKSDLRQQIDAYTGHSATQASPNRDGTQEGVK